MYAVSVTFQLGTCDPALLGSWQDRNEEKCAMAAHIPRLTRIQVVPAGVALLIATVACVTATIAAAQTYPTPAHHSRGAVPAGQHHHRGAHRY